MRKKTAATALTVLALAPALAACGSSSNSSAKSGAANATPSASATASATASSKAKGSTGANGCTPVSKKGNCYRPKEFCAKTQHGMKGIAADGKKIVCKQVNGQWVWQLA